MAHFYASIQGNRGEATRIGTKNSGIEGHIRGWNIGAEVRCHVNAKGQDVVEIWLTGGSNRIDSARYLGAFTEEDLDDAE